MNRTASPRPSHLTPADLRGVGASLRRIYTVSDDGSFDHLLGRLDRVASCSSGGRRG